MGNREISYSLDFGNRRRSESFNRPDARISQDPIPRVARLLALALRFEDQVREARIRNYAAIARVGHVTRARLTQIMRLTGLAPDIQEWILFAGSARRFNERNLRPVSACVEWPRQRLLFQKLFGIDLTVGPHRSDECPDRAASAARKSMKR